jgi:hypothetical protein
MVFMKIKVQALTTFVQFYPGTGARQNSRLGGCRHAINSEFPTKANTRPCLAYHMAWQTAG